MFHPILTLAAEHLDADFRAAHAAHLAHDPHARPPPRRARHIPHKRISAAVTPA